MLLNFGAESSMFEIRVNNRALMQSWYFEKFKLTGDSVKTVTRLVDRKNKMSAAEFKAEAAKIVNDPDAFISGLENPEPGALAAENSLQDVIKGLKELGIENVRFDASLARGFDYYTGTIFEIFDVSGENNRSLLGGGRYDNLTGLFGGDAIPGVGFGMGDVTMRDFLTTHGLLTGDITTAPVLMVIPTDTAHNLEGAKAAEVFRAHGIATAVDISDKKLGKKIGDASERGVEYILVIGEDEIKNRKATLKHLESGKETAGELHELAHVIDDTPHI
jgi:histidyl-tRNA synthetase